MDIQELSIQEIESASGGVAHILTAMLVGAGYLGALQVAADFGAGLGSGFYDATH